MEDLDRIERKLKKLRNWLLIRIYAEKENFEHAFFIEEQIDMNLEQIHAHITPI